MKVRFNILFILLGLGMMSCEDDDDSSTQDILQRNRDVVTRLINEGLNNNNSAIALELTAPGFVDLDAFPNQPDGPEGLQYHFDVINRSIPDLMVEFTLVAEGNTVVEEWTGRGNLQADFETGEPLPSPVPIVMNGITVFELNAEGLITERRTFQRGE